MRQNQTALTVERYLSGVVQNADSSEETTAAQNVVLQDHRTLAELLFISKHIFLIICIF